MATISKLLRVSSPSVFAALRLNPRNCAESALAVRGHSGNGERGACPLSHVLEHAAGSFVSEECGDDATKRGVPLALLLIQHVVLLSVLLELQEQSSHMEWDMQGM